MGGGGLVAVGGGGGQWRGQCGDSRGDSGRRSMKHSPPRLKHFFILIFVGLVS